MAISSSKGTVVTGRSVYLAYDYIPPIQQEGKPRKKAEPRQAAADPRQTATDPEPKPKAWQPEVLRTRANREDEESYRSDQDWADDIISQANQEAKEILMEARRQAEQMKAEAAEEGYQAGYEKGFKEGVDRAVLEHGQIMEDRQAEFEQDMRSALSSVAAAKQKCLQTYLNQLKDCSVAVAEKVIHISLRSSGEVIKQMLITETERLKKTAWVKIYMEKTDYGMMMETDADVISELSRLSDNIKFVVMDKDNRGNCIIEMPEEIIDISVDTQLENIKEILQNIRI